MLHFIGSMFLLLCVLYYVCFLKLNGWWNNNNNNNNINNNIINSRPNKNNCTFE